jgi:uncharacterized ion transporter superfamily protein YfcC
MNGRNAALAGTLFFVVAFFLLTVNVMIREGIDVLVLISLVILAMVGFGVLGALLNPPRE